VASADTSLLGVIMTLSLHRLFTHMSYNCDVYSPNTKTIYKTPFVLGTSCPPVLSAACRIASAKALNADSALLKGEYESCTMASTYL
jgi:hypothetical protein